MANHDTWFIQTAILKTQTEAVMASLLSHGIQAHTIVEQIFQPKNVDKNYTLLGFPISVKNALTVITAIAHAAKNDNPKSTKVFLSPVINTVTLNI